MPNPVALNCGVVSKAKHYKGVSIQIFDRIVYSIVVIDTEIPAAVRFVPKVVQQIGIKMAGAILKDRVHRQAISLREEE